MSPSGVATLIVYPHSQRKGSILLHLRLSFHILVEYIVVNENGFVYISDTNGGIQVF